MLASTFVLLLGLVCTYVALPSDSAAGVFTVAAVGVGLSLSIATSMEAKTGVRSLIRVDILMLWVLYGLTFLEFLFPQPDIDAVLGQDIATNGTIATILGFGGLAVGRHLVPWRDKSQIAEFLEV